MADHVIAQQVQPGDLVITGDIPLASWVIDAGGEALNPRGEIYTRETIKARLGMRNFMEELRSAGVQTGGPAPSMPPTNSASPTPSTSGWSKASCKETLKAPCLGAFSP